MRLPYVLGFTVMLAAATFARADTYVYDYTYQNQTSTFGFTYDSQHLIATDQTVTPLTCQLYTQCSTVSIDPTESEIVFNNSSGGTLTINGLPSGFFTVGQHTSVSWDKHDLDQQYSCRRDARTFGAGTDQHGPAHDGRHRPQTAVLTPRFPWGAGIT